MAEDMIDALFGDDEKEEKVEESSLTAEKVEEERNGISTDELQSLFGPVNKERFFPMGSAILKKVRFGVKFDEDDEKREHPKENQNQIVCFFDVKDTFGDYVEATINFYKDDDADKQKKTDKKIQYCFGAYGGVDSYEKLTQFAKSSDEKVNSVIEKLKDSVGEDKLLVPIYRGSFTANSSDGIAEDRIYYTPINRIRSAGSNNYSDFYKEHGGFPGYPDRQAFVECVNNDSENDIMEAQVMSINNNKNFKRFEVELRPVNVSDKYKKYLEDNNIYSFLATYNYGKGSLGEQTIDLNKRTRQSQRIASALGVLDYGEVKSKVGEIVGVIIKSYESTKGSNKVYRASICRLN